MALSGHGVASARAQITCSSPKSHNPRGVPMKIFARYSAAAAAVMLLTSAFVSAQQTVLTADTQINSAAPTTNYGSSPTLQVGGGYSTLLQFDVAHLLPSGTTAAQLLDARLVIFPDKITTGGTIGVYQVTSAWDEGSVTYASKPAA